MELTVEYLHNRLQSAFSEIDRLKEAQGLLARELEHLLIPADQSLQIKHVVSELRKGNKKPWNEMQRLKKSIYGITRKKKSSR